MTCSEVSGSSLPRSVLGCITSFLLFVCIQGRPHFTAQQNITKDSAENFLLLLSWYLNIIYQSFPSTCTEPVDDRQSTQEGKQTSQESASTSKSLISNQALCVGEKMLILTLENTKVVLLPQYQSGLHRLLQHGQEAEFQLDMCRIVHTKSLSACVSSCLVVHILFKMLFAVFKFVFIVYDPCVRGSCLVVCI